MKGEETASKLLQFCMHHSCGKIHVGELEKIQITLNTHSVVWCFNGMKLRKPWVKEVAAAALRLSSVSFVSFAGDKHKKSTFFPTVTCHFRFVLIYFFYDAMPYRI